MLRGGDVLDQAKRLVESGRWADAVSILETWVHENPRSAAGWSALGAAYFGVADFEAAVRAARKAVETEPSSARNWCNYGTVLRKLGRIEEARKAQRCALSVAPDYQRAFTELGKLSEIPTHGRQSPSDRDAIVAHGQTPPLPSPRWRLGRRAISIAALLALGAASGSVMVTREWGNPPDEIAAGKAQRPAQGAQSLLPTSEGEDPVPPIATASGTGAAADREVMNETPMTGVSEVAPPVAATGTSEGVIGSRNNPAESVRSEADKENEQRRIALAWLRYGKNLYSNQEYEEAIEAFEKARCLGGIAQTWIDASHERIDIAEGRLVEGTPQQAPTPRGSQASYVHPSGEMTDDDFEALMAAHRAVREEAWNPSSVRFRWGFLGLEGSDSERVARSGDVCVVTGRVRGQNAFGATVENRYSVMLIRVDGRWVALQVSEG